MWYIYVNAGVLRGRVCTFSSSWRSCLPLASLEHRFCSGATTVQIQRPSASWAELYTCHPSFGLMVCRQRAHSPKQAAHMALLWGRGTQLLCFVSFFLVGQPFFCLMLPKLWHQPIPLEKKVFERTKCFCCKIFCSAHSIRSLVNFLFNNK